MPGDPNDYSAVFATVGLADLEESAINLSRVLEADGAVAQASLVRQAFLKLLAELKLIAKSTSVDARSMIRDEELSTRVRPVSHASGGGASLQDFIGISAPLPAVEGSVGINDEQILDDSPVFWWLQHELGSDVHLGQQLKGFFEPGHEAPQRSQFRNHPVFTPSRGGKLGVVDEPIPDRHFVENGAARAEIEWHAKIRAAKTKFTTECSRAVASAPPPKPRGGRGRGKGRRP